MGNSPVDSMGNFEIPLKPLPSGLGEGAEPAFSISSCPCTSMYLPAYPSSPLSI